MYVSSFLSHALENLASLRTANIQNTFLIVVLTCVPIPEPDPQDP
jgi:hypothetical protein